MHGFKSAILAEWKNCQNGTFEPVHEIQNFFWQKDFFWGIMNVPFTKSIHNMPQGPSNPGFMQLKVQKGDFLKKPSREMKFFFLFYVPMNLSKVWNAKLEAASFLAI